MRPNMPRSLHHVELRAPWCKCLLWEAQSSATQWVMSNGMRCVVCALLRGERRGRDATEADAAVVIRMLSAGQRAGAACQELRDRAAVGSVMMRASRVATHLRWCSAITVPPRHGPAHVVYSQAVGRPSHMVPPAQMKPDQFAGRGDHARVVPGEVSRASGCPKPGRTPATSLRTAAGSFGDRPHRRRRLAVAAPR